MQMCGVQASHVPRWSVANPVGSPQARQSWMWRVLLLSAQSSQTANPLMVAGSGSSIACVQIILFSLVCAGDSLTNKTYTTLNPALIQAVAREKGPHPQTRAKKFVNAQPVPRPVREKQKTPPRLERRNGVPVLLCRNCNLRHVNKSGESRHDVIGQLGLIRREHHRVIGVRSGVSLLNCHKGGSHSGIERRDVSLRS